MSHNHDDEALIEQARRGDRLALEELLVRHAGELAEHIAHRLPKSVQDVFGVEDVTQQALLEASVKIELLRGTSRVEFVAWLKAIGKTTLMGMIKQQRRQKRGGHFQRAWALQGNATDSLFDLLDALPDDVVTASRCVARSEAIRALQVGIAGLPPEQRRAIQLHLLEGKSLEETSSEMDKTQSAVRNLVHRGKQNLAEAMGRASMWLSGR